MTKKEFKRAMQCGLGRCIQELQSCDDIEKYRDIVLWGCTHNLAYDAQSEGTRSDYLYQLVKCYPDETPFVDAVIISLKKSSTKSGWDFLQFCRFLELSARDGNSSAANALYDQYQQMYGLLKEQKRHLPQKMLPVLENFEDLCISIIHLPGTQEECESTYVSVVEDLGVLIADTFWFHTRSFVWFQTCAEDILGKRKTFQLVKKKARLSKYANAYLDFLTQEKEETKLHTETYTTAANITATEIYETLQQSKLSDSTTEFSVLWTGIMQRTGNGTEVKELADYYQKETDLYLRCRLLHLLGNRYSAQLLNAQSVIADSQSNNPELRKNAFRALEYMKDDAIRDYALELFQKKKYSENIIYMLANNYHKEDYKILVSLVKSLPVTYHEDIYWHGPYSAVLDMFKKGGAGHPPKELLPYLYEHTLCSCCREYTLREMSRRRMVSRQLLEECQYDCNDGIREFAEKRLKGR